MHILEKCKIHFKPQRIYTKTKQEYLYFSCIKHPDGEKDIRLNQQCLWLTSVS